MIGRVIGLVCLIGIVMLVSPAIGQDAGPVCEVPRWHAQPGLMVAPTWFGPPQIYRIWTQPVYPDALTVRVGPLGFRSYRWHYRFPRSPASALDAGDLGGADPQMPGVCLGRRASDE